MPPRAGRLVGSHQFSDCSQSQSPGRGARGRSGGTVGSGGHGLLLFFILSRVISTKVRIGTLCMYVLSLVKMMMHKMMNAHDADSLAYGVSQPHTVGKGPLRISTTSQGLKKTGPKTVELSSCDVICGYMKIVMYVCT